MNRHHVDKQRKRSYSCQAKNVEVMRPPLAELTPNQQDYSVWLPKSRSSLDYHRIYAKSRKRAKIVSDLGSAPTDVELESDFGPPLGSFFTFPLDVILQLLDTIPVANLTVLAYTSKGLNQVIERYVFFGYTRKRFAVESNKKVPCVEKMTNKDCFHNWGRLLKAVTIVKASYLRRILLSRFFEMNKAVNNQHGWGRLFIMFSENWEFSECMALYGSILRLDGGFLIDSIKLLLNREPGELPQLEMKVRHFLHGYFLDHFLVSNEQGFWLSIILSHLQNMDEKGIIILILFGPTKFVNGNECIDWKNFTESTAASYTASLGAIEPISQCLFNLYKTIDNSASEHSLSQLDLFNIIEEVTTTPEPWMYENFMALLFHRIELMPIMIVSRIRIGALDEVKQMLVSLRDALARWRFRLENALFYPLFKTMLIMSVSEKLFLLETLCSLATDRLVEIEYESDGNEGLSSDEIYSYRAMLRLIHRLAMTLSMQ